MWRTDVWTDEGGTLLEVHISPLPDDADGWDGVQDERRRQYVHWHERSADDLRAFHEIPEATVDRLAELMGVDRQRDKLSLHDLLAILELRLG